MPQNAGTGEDPARVGANCEAADYHRPIRNAPRRGDRPSPVGGQEITATGAGRAVERNMKRGGVAHDAIDHHNIR